MWAGCVVAATVAVAAAVYATQDAAGGGGYTFYRDMEAAGGQWARGAGGSGGGTRRIFGGASAELEVFPLVVALLDRYWSARCSGAAVAPHWVLTAAHCVTPRLAYVKFEVVQSGGQGADVTLLHHDVGLVRAREPLRLRHAPPPDLAAALRRYNALNLNAEEVQVLGFGRTERSLLGEELFGTRLKLVRCESREWRYCVCGAASGSKNGTARGVCSGDSGGPVLYRGVQVGVTSMGPVRCARAGGVPPEGSTSVFTSLFQYADVVNATVTDAEAALRMARVGHAPPPMTPPLVVLLTWALLPAR